MITLRMLGIALAILLALPFGYALANHGPPHLVVPGGDVVDFTGDAIVEVTDIVLLDLPERYDRQVIHNTPEQLVEGHTVFTVIDIPVVKNVTNWTAELIGSVDCKVNQTTSGRYWNGIPIPQRVDRLRLECHAAGNVWVTPDPFYDSDDTVQQTSMTPTGVTIPFTAPNGQSAEATEYTFDLIVVDRWSGEATTRTLYAWSVPTLEPWTHRDGSTKSWYCPIPLARVQEMGVTTFSVRLESDPFAA